MENPADLTPVKPRRSALFMPASNARALEKAASLTADVLIFDLEDSVAPGQKQAARDFLLAAAKRHDYSPFERIVRVNGLSSPFVKDDIAAALETDPHAILFPKVETAKDVCFAQALVDQLAGRHRHISIWAMVETPLAVLNIREIVEAGHTYRLGCLVIGPNDLAKDSRITPGEKRCNHLPALTQILIAARGAGAASLTVLDGVYGDFRDDSGFTAECAQGAELGFDGKTLIHPAQIAQANIAFAPGEAEIAEANAIVAAFALPENADKGAIQLNGKMVELLHLETARNRLALANAIKARQTGNQR